MFAIRFYTNCAASGNSMLRYRFGLTLSYTFSGKLDRIIQKKIRCKPNQRVSPAPFFVRETESLTIFRKD